MLIVFFDVRVKSSFIPGVLIKHCVSFLSTAHWHAIISVSKAQKLQQNTVCVECRNTPLPPSIFLDLKINIKTNL